MEGGTGFYEGIAGELHYRWWSAEAPKWTILFAHGFGDHSGRYSRFAETIAGFGGALFVPDYRGHGLSSGERLALDDVDTVASEYLQVADLPSFPSGIPIILAGHSFGGLVVSRAALLKQIDVAGLVASGARIGGWPAGEELLDAIDRGEVDPIEGARGNPILDPNVEFPRSVLSRDEAIFEQFADDPLSQRGAYSVPALRAYIRATKQLQEVSAVFDFPVLYLHGGADPIAQFRQSAQRIIQLAGDDLEIHIFPGARHSTYNELNRDEVFEVLRRFIERAISAN
jgi:alpha-beta hydrolase superfamily lysophospholipase